ncbi:phage tail tube protein [Streptomyces scabiei]|uniref:phage tail tube protein n=1 Tax=Streptomyces scabiei TaxID=1930 RepID=UPI0038F81217
MPVKKYMRRGTSKFYFVPTIAAESMIPTRTELNAGTEFSEYIAAMDGWTVANQEIDTPDMADTYDSTIPGSDKADSSSFTFYEDEEDADMEQTFAKGTNAYVVILRKGDIPGNNSMDIFPIRVASQSPQYTAENEAAKFMATCSITSRPLQGASVPVAGTDEVQTVTITGSPTGGTYTLTFSGQTTAGIAYNAAAAAVQSALEALSNIASGDVVCGGGPHPGTPVTVTFGGDYDGEDVPQMTASAAGLTGGTSPAVTVTTTTPGG